MDMTNLENQVLLLANEDYSGLWEVYFEAKDIFGELSQNELIGRARKVINKFLDLGWIQLYWCNEPLTNQRVKPVEQSDVMEALSVVRYWEPPEKDSVSIRFLATGEGERIYTGGGLK
jgi:hypothetical protein